MPASSEDDLLDVVDEFDRPVERLPRRVVHERGLRHRSVHVLLNDGTGRLFLQKRSLRKDTNPGLWDTSAAGHVDAGETPRAAAARELAEELGVVVPADALRRLFTLAPEPDTGNEFLTVYRARSDAPITLEADEIDAGCWVDADRFERWSRDEPGSFTTVLRTIIDRAGLHG